jgi:pilus assembly protein CpaB
MKGTLTTILMMGGALGAAGAAAYLADRYIERAVAERRTALDAQYRPVRAVVANADLRAGVLLSGQTVALREVPRAFLHSEAVLADDWNQISGRVLAHAVKSGEPVLRSHLAQDAGAGFSTQLAAGMRAMTFPVNDETSISGMLAPGDRIDLFFTTTNGNEPMTLPLLLNVPIIATGVRTITNTSYLSDKEQLGQYRTITVSVTADEAARITLAQDAGKISVALRQPQDEEDVQLTRITKSTLVNGSRQVAASFPRRKVEIILGGI